MLKSWHPEVFQGSLRRRHYFEGWYFKLIDKERKNAFAVIPGISLGGSLEESHAFVQCINAVTGKVHYFRYPVAEFNAADGLFDVRIGPNSFSRQGMRLRLADQSGCINADIGFSNILRFPERRPFPGIMGPFTFAPGMECYHGVVNISHTISGSMFVDGEETDFSGGEGYIEKDWGRSFPDAWTWMQANHFEKPASFMFSLASIPWLGRHFPGLISFLLIDGKFMLFATYNFARTRHVRVGEASLEAAVTKGRLLLELEASYDKAGELAAPKNGMMTRVIKESITAVVKVRLTDRSEGLVFEGTSGNTGLEICGDLGKYLKVERI